MIDDELRQHLQERSRDVPELEAMRERVRSRLGPTPATNRRRNGLVTGAIAAALALIALALQPSSRIETTDLAVEQPAVAFDLPSGPIEGQRFAPAGLEVGLELVVPSGAGSPQLVSSRQLTIPLANDRSASLHLLFPPNTSIEASVRAIRSSASDTEVLTAGRVTVGDRDGRRLVLASERGTSQVAYQVGFATYLRVSGVDRRHEVLVVPADPGGTGQSLVIWIELPREGGESARSRAAEIIASIAMAR